MVEKKTIKMKEQPVEERIKNFNEVPLGYTENEAILEAERCLQCKNPTCIQGCPVNINIKKFIWHIVQKDYKAGIDVIKNDNSLPAVCGRVCPQETQCEQACILNKKGVPINIGALERFLADWEALNIKDITKKDISEKYDKNGNAIKVAIVGSGPAGLTAAGELAKMGYSVTVFEAMHVPGGVLIYGIPEFRLPKDIVYREVNYLKNLGVKFELNTIIGKTYKLKELFDMGYKAIFIGIGAGTPIFMNIPGETLKGVFSANEFLTRINAMKGYKFPEYDTPVKVGKRVAVVGGGNVAMDTARTLKRLKGVEEVWVVYRRSEKEMPARIEEIHRAKEEKINFHFLTNPVEIIGNENGWVKALKCVRMKLGEPDESGRRRPIPIEGSECMVEVDSVIMALGTKANKLLLEEAKDLKLNKRGYIEVNPETGETSIKGVFAGGDITTGASTVISAMGAGKRAAKSIDEYIKNL